LNALADEGFVVTATGEYGGTIYRRSLESLVVDQAADILEQASTDELIMRIAEMCNQLRDSLVRLDSDSSALGTVRSKASSLRANLEHSLRKAVYNLL